MAHAITQSLDHATHMHTVGQEGLATQHNSKLFSREPWVFFKLNNNNNSSNNNNNTVIIIII